VTRAEWERKVKDFTSRLVILKAEAGRLGLLKTMHALDGATNATGWEQADIKTGQLSQPWRRKL
jgi:hypothetical protein